MSDQTATSKHWELALEQFGENHTFKALFRSPIEHPDLNADLIIAGFINAFNTIETLHRKQEKISLRTLSALCFSGDSKFLDKRRKFIEHVFPLAKEVVEARIIMLSAYIPRQLEQAIFIENFDSFRATVKAIESSDLSATTAVIYSAGYRGSAADIRKANTCQFVTMNQLEENHFDSFMDWWFSKDQSIPVYFWGDLDFDGMSIIKSLREKFHNVIALKSTYEAMLRHHQNGVSHGDLNSRTHVQKDPIATGCAYTDSVLLPLLRETRQYTDQEVVGGKELASAIRLAFKNQ